MYKLGNLLKSSIRQTGLITQKTDEVKNLKWQSSPHRLCGMVRGRNAWNVFTCGWNCFPVK